MRQNMPSHSHHSYKHSQAVTESHMHRQIRAAVCRDLSHCMRQQAQRQLLLKLLQAHSLSLSTHLPQQTHGHRALVLCSTSAQQGKWQILGALAPRHQGQWTCPQLSSMGAFSHSPMWVSNPQQREEGLHPPLLGHCRGHMDWTIQSRGRGVLQQPWQCRAKSNLSREDSVRSARLSLWGWTAGQGCM